MAGTARSFELVDTDRTDLRFLDALSDLFAEDGTIYLVSGYFTYQGYLAIRDDIFSFLERNRQNELILIVGPASDQFSPRIAHELWKRDAFDQVQLFKQPRGLHAKLYFRDGPMPRIIIGSANITRVAIEYNTELNIMFGRGQANHPDIEPIREWVTGLVDSSKPLRRFDIVAPVLILSSLLNWSNKAMILPPRNVVLRAIPILLLLLLFGSIMRII